MKKQVKADKTNWFDTESSEKDKGNKESIEISSDEEELEGGANEIMTEAHSEPNPSTPSPTQGERQQTEQPADFFEGGMIASRDKVEPSHRLDVQTSAASSGDVEA